MSGIRPGVGRAGRRPSTEAFGSGVDCRFVDAMISLKPTANARPSRSPFRLTRWPTLATRLKANGDNRGSRARDRRPCESTTVSLVRKDARAVGLDYATLASAKG